MLLTDAHCIRIVVWQPPSSTTASILSTNSSPRDYRTNKNPATATNTLSTRAMPGSRLPPELCTYSSRRINHMRWRCSTWAKIDQEKDTWSTLQRTRPSNLKRSQSTSTTTWLSILLTCLSTFVPGNHAQRKLNKTIVVRRLSVILGRQSHLFNFSTLGCSPFANTPFWSLWEPRCRSWHGMPSGKWRSRCKRRSRLWSCKRDRRRLKTWTGTRVVSLCWHRQSFSRRLCSSWKFAETTWSKSLWHRYISPPCAFFSLVLLARYLLFDINLTIRRQHSSHGTKWISKSRSVSSSLARTALTREDCARSGFYFLSVSCLIRSLVSFIHTCLLAHVK